MFMSEMPGHPVDTMEGRRGWTADMQIEVARLVAGGRASVAKANVGKRSGSHAFGARGHVVDEKGVDLGGNHLHFKETRTLSSSQTRHRKVH